MNINNIYRLKWISFTLIPLGYDTASVLFFIVCPLVNKLLILHLQKVILILKNICGIFILDNKFLYVIYV